VIRSHLDAVAALLAPLKSAPANMPVYVGSVDGDDAALTDLPPAHTPYVVVRSDTMPITSDRLAPWSQRLDGRVYIQAVGADWREAAWALEATRALLSDVAPAVTGRSVAALALEGGQPIEADRDVTPPLFMGVDVYRLMSV
jgi:hypothetical protein